MPDHTFESLDIPCVDKPVYHRLLVRGQRVSAITAITTDGLLDVELTIGSVNADKFVDFVRGSVIPNMHPFDDTNTKSITILDNSPCSSSQRPL